MQQPLTRLNDAPVAVATATVAQDLIQKTTGVRALESKKIAHRTFSLSLLLDKPQVLL
jgi:hypothetical protein